MRIQHDLCRRSVEYISRELDGDLAEFEGALLRAHLSSCEECRSVAERMTAHTVALRSAVLEPIPHPIALPSRRRHRVSAAAGAAAAVAAAVVGVTTFVGFRVNDQASARQALPRAFEARDVLVRQARLKQMQLYWLSKARPVKSGPLNSL
jgi:predicted anti-sigma-YlaC factor YlaD